MPDDRRFGMSWLIVKICWYIRFLRGRDIITSIRDGNWSESTTWDYNVPKDGDTVIINHNVTFDADQKKFKIGNKIWNYMQFIVTRNPGSYCLRCFGGFHSSGRIDCCIDDWSSMVFDFMDGDGFNIYGVPKLRFEGSKPHELAK